MNSDHLHASLVVIDALQYSNWDRKALAQWREGGLTAVHVTCAIWEKPREAMANVMRWHRRAEEHHDLICIAESAGDVRLAKKAGRTAVILGFQNASPFEDDLDLVEVFRRLGVRISQLTYNCQNQAGGSCYEPADSGLTRYGKNLVAEMNRNHMIVDTSHSSERTTLEAAQASQAPIVATHANPRAVFDHPRNKSDQVLREIAAGGGMLGCTPYPHLLPMTGDQAASWADAVCHAIDVMGIDHVGVGTDLSLGWDDDCLAWIRNGTWTRTADTGASLTGNASWEPWPAYFQGPADFPSLTRTLLVRGLEEDEVRKVMGANWLRFLEEHSEV